MDLIKLQNIVKSRIADTENNDSYTKSLFNKNINKVVEKFGEESIEVIIASLKEEKEDIIHEMADLLFHLVVVATKVNINIEEILSELEKRNKQ